MVGEGNALGKQTRTLFQIPATSRRQEATGTNMGTKHSESPKCSTGCKAPPSASILSVDFDVLRASKRFDDASQVASPPPVTRGQVFGPPYRSMACPQPPCPLMSLCLEPLIKTPQAYLVECLSTFDLSKHVASARRHCALQCGLETFHTNHHSPSPTNPWIP